jgi:hypothetical protein
LADECEEEQLTDIRRPLPAEPFIDSPTTGDESSRGAAQEEPSAQQQLSELSCDQLWFARNSIFKAAGFCFKTPRMYGAKGD